MTVIQFPLRVEVEERSCSGCENVALGTKGLFCTEFREPIVSDDVAEDCPEFTPY